MHHACCVAFFEISLGIDYDPLIQFMFNYCILSDMPRLGVDYVY